jgi:hypothetical protein
MNANEMIARAEFLSTQYDCGTFQLGSDSAGAARKCIVEGEYAFKCIKEERDAVQNCSEWDFYTMTTDSIRAMLAKPVYISRNGNVIVMEALIPWRERNDPNEEKYGYLSHWEKCLDEDMSATYGFTIGDSHGGNWGIEADGTVVMLDYASLELQCTDWEWSKTPTPARWGADRPKYQRGILLEYLWSNEIN